MRSELDQVFHDIRNELQLLTGNTDFLAQRDDDPLVGETLAELRAAAGRLRTLLDRLFVLVEGP